MKRSYRKLSFDKIENIQMLAKVGLSLKEISAELDVPKTTVYHYAKNYCKKMTYMDVNALSEMELGYLVGMFVGDGCFIVKLENGTYVTKSTLDATRDEDIANFLQGLFEKTSKRVGRRIEKSSIVFRVHSKDFVEFLSHHVKCTKQSDSPRNVKVLINRKKWATLFKLGFIGGLIDSDGHVYYNRKRTRHFGVLIKTANESLRDDIVRILFSLGIKVTTYLAKSYEGSYSGNPRYVVYIPRAELKKVDHKIPAVKLERDGRK